MKFDPTTPLTPPDTLPNYARLRRLVEDLRGTDQDTPLSKREAILVAHIAWREGMENDERALMEEFVQSLSFHYEIQQQGRFTVIASFLSPDFGYIARYPSYVARSARYLLDDQQAQEREHAQVNWELLHKLFPEHIELPTARRCV